MIADQAVLTGVSASFACVPAYYLLSPSLTWLGLSLPEGTSWPVADLYGA